MKKIIFSVMIAAASLSLYAQETQEVTVYRLSRSTSYPGYSVPPAIKANFEKTYPGVTVISWDPIQTYWRAGYKVENSITYVYYDEKGVNYRASLPVIQNNVPEPVVTKALDIYGPIVYGITKIKSANGGEVFQLRLVENGVTRTTWMDAEGKTVTDVFKVKAGEGEVKVKTNEG